MKAKHFFVFCCGIFCFCAGLYAETASNDQKIFPIDSEAYQALTFLYIDQGYALPSSAGPWSADELIRMLEKIDPAALSAGARRAYDFAAAELAPSGKVVRFGLDVSAEVYAHTNTVSFTAEEDWIRGFDERSPFLDLALETWPGEHFYGYTSLSIGNNAFNNWDSVSGPTSTLFGQSAVTCNIPMIPPAVMSALDFNIPYRAFGAFGGDNWSAQVGREKLSWGPGESGNFVLGDHVPYHNVGRITTYTPVFKYTFITSFFPYPSDYYSSTPDANGSYLKSGSQSELLKGLNMFMAHRVEWRLFRDRLGFALTEAVMYQSEEGILDLRVLSPTMIFHDYYIRANGNSILALEADWTPIPRVNIYGQLAMDEFCLPGEPVPGVDNAAHPDGFGYMLGGKTAFPLNGGMFYASLEGVFTDPYLYLRYGEGGYTSDPSASSHGLNWVVATRYFANAFGVVYDEDFLGYRYGGDAIVLNLNAGYKEFGAWSIEGNFLYMIHGTHDKWTVWTLLDAGEYPVGPTTSHDTPNYVDSDVSDRNAVSHTLVFGIKGDYAILPRLRGYGETDFVHVINPENDSANAPISDFQVTLGVEYSL